MRRRKMVMEKKITMRRADISGAKKEQNGTGITRKIRRLTKEEIPCLILLTHLFI
jgi:hypothetical protein